MHVAIIDSSRMSPSRAALYESFSGSLSEGMTKVCGGPVTVKAVSVEPQRAATLLASGGFDFVVVISNDVPSQLDTADFAAVRVTSEIGVPACVFQLVMRKDEPAMKTMITAAFDATLAQPHFQDVLGRAVAVKVVASNER